MPLLSFMLKECLEMFLFGASGAFLTCDVLAALGEAAETPEPGKYTSTMRDLAGQR